MIKHFLFTILFLSSGLNAQNPDRGTELVKIKQEEVREKLQSFEETMEKLSRVLLQTEPQNAAKLLSAFQSSRERLLREGMDQVVRFIEEKKLDRAIEDQTRITENLKELLSILLEKDIDPRKLMKHIRRVRDVLEDIDKVIEEETSEKIASDLTLKAETQLKSLSDALVRLDELIRKEKGIEAEVKGSRDMSKLAKLMDRQKNLKAETEKLRMAAMAGASRPNANSSSNDSPGVMDLKSLGDAERAMMDAVKSMQAENTDGAASQAARARQLLETARADAEKKLEQMRSMKDFTKMKQDQDSTQDRTKDLLKKMKRTPPLVFTPEGGIPGRKDVQQSLGSMDNASGSLSGGKSQSASRSQGEALTRLRSGKQKVEETLEFLQQALRDRILSYLREKFTLMLKKQRNISRETSSLDSRMRALEALKGTEDSRKQTAVDPSDDAQTTEEKPAKQEVEAVGAEKSSREVVQRKDLQRAEDLSRREGRLAVVAEDIKDLLLEDGTTLVFPRIVQEIKRDLESVEGLISNVRIGELTQRIQQEIIETIEEILKAIKEVQKSPPPPNPDKGRKSKNGSGPLLPTSAELKMIRSMQQRVNKRTCDFDLDRGNDKLDLEEQRQSKLLAERQAEIEDLFRKISRQLGP